MTYWPEALSDANLLHPFLCLRPLCDIRQRLTRAPLGYFYNAPHWGGGAISSPPSDLRNYWADSKNSSGI